MSSRRNRKRGPGNQASRDSMQPGQNMPDTEPKGREASTAVKDDSSDSSTEVTQRVEEPADDFVSSRPSAQSSGSAAAEEPSASDEGGKNPLKSSASGLNDDDDAMRYDLANITGFSSTMEEALPSPSALQAEGPSPSGEKPPSNLTLNNEDRAPQELPSDVVLSASDEKEMYVQQQQQPTSLIAGGDEEANALQRGLYDQEYEVYELEPLSPFLQSQDRFDAQPDNSLELLGTASPNLLGASSGGQFSDRDVAKGFSSFDERMHILNGLVLSLEEGVGSGRFSSQALAMQTADLVGAFEEDASSAMSKASRLHKSCPTACPYESLVNIFYQRLSTILRMLPKISEYVTPSKEPQVRDEAASTPTRSIKSPEEDKDYTIQKLRQENYFLKYSYVKELGADSSAFSERAESSTQVSSQQEVWSPPQMSPLRVESPSNIEPTTEEEAQVQEEAEETWTFHASPRRTAKPIPPTAASKSPTSSASGFEPLAESSPNLEAGRVAESDSDLPENLESGQEQGFAPNTEVESETGSQHGERNSSPTEPIGNYEQPSFEEASMKGSPTFKGGESSKNYQYSESAHAAEQIASTPEPSESIEQIESKAEANSESWGGDSAPRPIEASDHAQFGNKSSQSPPVSVLGKDSKQAGSHHADEQIQQTIKPDTRPKRSMKPQPIRIEARKSSTQPKEVFPLGSLWYDADEEFSSSPPLADFSKDRPRKTTQLSPTFNDSDTLIDSESNVSSWLGGTQHSKPRTKRRATKEECSYWIRTIPAPETPSSLPRVAHEKDNQFGSYSEKENAWYSEDNGRWIELRRFHSAGLNTTVRCLHEADTAIHDVSSTVLPFLSDTKSLCVGSWVFVTALCGRVLSMLMAGAKKATWVFLLRPLLFLSMKLISMFRSIDSWGRTAGRSGLVKHAAYLCQAPIRWFDSIGDAIDKSRTAQRLARFVRVAIFLHNIVVYVAVKREREMWTEANNLSRLHMVRWLGRQPSLWMPGVDLGRSFEWADTTTGTMLVLQMVDASLGANSIVGKHMMQVAASLRDLAMAVGKSGWFEAVSFTTLFFWNGLKFWVMDALTLPLQYTWFLLKEMAKVGVWLVEVLAFAIGLVQAWIEMLRRYPVYQRIFMY